MDYPNLLYNKNDIKNPKIPIASAIAIPINAICMILPDASGCLDTASAAFAVAIPTPIAAKPPVIIANATAIDSIPFTSLVYGF